VHRRLDLRVERGLREPDKVFSTFLTATGPSYESLSSALGTLANFDTSSEDWKSLNSCNDRQHAEQLQRTM
jgi:succinate dehydrogenase flavin-adding protein (antitoxin of CptAB toxin-antitoxin module)